MTFHGINAFEGIELLSFRLDGLALIRMNQAKIIVSHEDKRIERFAELAENLLPRVQSQDRNMPRILNRISRMR